MKRIQREIQHEELVQKLTSQEGAIFNEIWRLMLFAASIGLKEKKKTPLGKTDSGKAIPETYFGNPGWRGFLYLIGITQSESTECLQNTDEAKDQLIKDFEEYANTGLIILSEQLESQIDILDSLFHLLNQSDSQFTEPDVFELI